MQKQQLQRAGQEEEQVHDEQPGSLARKKGGRGQWHRVSLLVQQQPGPAVLLINGSPAAKMGIVLLHSHPCRPGTADFYQTFTFFFDNLQVLSENIAELSTGFVSLSKSDPPPCCPLSSRHLP